MNRTSPIMRIASCIFATVRSFLMSRRSVSVKALHACKRQAVQPETPAMFHLTTHAFFKALLFLAAGSVIIGMHHEQDIWQMGNLRKKMPVTFLTFTIGTLALCGVPPFSGFYSKDAILAQALAQKSYLLFGVGVFVAALTTFYTFRLFFVVFCGKEKSKAAAHAHESPWVMTLPLI